MIMKIALLAVLYISSAAASTCQIYKCASSVGATCGQTGTSNPTTYTSCTGTNQFCNTTSSVCTAKFANGNSCGGIFGSETCQSGYCRQDGTCQPGDLANGQTCKYNADCDSGNCNSNNQCVGANVGGSCTSDQNCNEADYLYCGSNGQCALTSFVNINGDCSSTSSECAYGLFCNSNTKCVPLYSVGSGGTCSDDTTSGLGGSDNDNQCSDGLTCQNGKCAAAPSSSGKSCQSDSDCTAANEACTCNYNTGSGTCQSKYINKPSGSSAVSSAVTSCYTGACSSTPTEDCTCNYNTGSGTCQSKYINKPSGSSAVSSAVTSCYTGACSSTPTEDCAISKCKSGFCASQRYLVNFDNQGSSNYPSCLGRTETVPTICNGASTVAASAFVVFAAAAALMM